MTAENHDGTANAARGFFSCGCRFVFLDLRGGRIRPMPKPSLPLVMCLGNFDGVHVAHSHLLAHGAALRDQHFPHGLWGAFTFFKPTFDFFSADSEPKGKHLTTLKDKVRLFADLGMDFVCLCDFEQIRTLSPEDFLTLLRCDLGVSATVCGFNFRFGKDGLGDSSLLSAYFDSPSHGLYCHVAPPYLMDGIPVSSTRIRQLLLTGHAEAASHHLGRPYALEGRVVHGKHLGQTWGFPTANQYFPAECIVPAHGVYAVLCHTPHGVYPGVANIGSHPTVDRHAPVNCETHIIGYDQNLYGMMLKVEFLHRLRQEVKFPTQDALKDAIGRDIAQAKAYIASYKVITPSRFS